MIKMKSTARGPFKYGGALVHPNTEFSVKSARDAKLLTAMKRAALFSPPVKAEEKKVEKAETKRTYKRRDMTSEPAAGQQLTPTGVVLTEGDSAADLKGEPRPDNQDRSSWAENEKPAE